MIKVNLELFRAKIIRPDSVTELMGPKVFKIHCTKHRYFKIDSFDKSEHFSSIGLDIVTCFMYLCTIFCNEVLFVYNQKLRS